MRATHKPDRHTIEEAPQNTQRYNNGRGRSQHICMLAVPRLLGWLHQDRHPLGPVAVWFRGGLQTHGCLGGERLPLRPHPWRQPGAYHCYLSLRPALETGDRRAFRERTAACLCMPFHSGLEYETCTPQEKQTDTDFSFFLFYIFFPPLRRKFKRAAGFCRLGSHSGRNTRPSSYSPSCPSLTKLSPSVTSSSDRRRPLGLCQNWATCECWTGMREKKQDTTHRRSEVKKDSTFNRSFSRVRRYFLGGEHARILRETSRRGRKELKETELSSQHRKEKTTETRGKRT